MKKQIKALKDWGMLDPKNLTLLALHLGYNSPETIKKWIERDSIPSYQTERVKEFINELTKKRHNGQN